MEHSKSTSTAKKGQLVDVVIQLSSNIRTQSSDKATNSSLEDLKNEIESQIQILKACNPRSLSTEHHGQLHTAGLGLWNWCTQEKRSERNNSSPERTKFLSVVRVLAFSMLILAQYTDDNSRKTLIHLERLALKTGRSCITSNELDFSLWALQKAVEYNGLLQGLQGSPLEGESHTCSQFEAEYSTLRIVLAWKEDRMDVAEHLYTSLEKTMAKVDIPLAEKLTDALFEIGRDLMQQKNFILAAKWLERAYEFINAQEISRLSRDAIELRLAISQALIQVYLDIGSPEFITRAKNHIAYVESELGDKLIVLLFRAEVLLRSPAEIFDSKAYADTLRRIIRTVDMSEASFKLIIHHIRKLDEKDQSAASSVLDDFMVTCIVTSGQDQWIDRAIILRTDMTTRDGSPDSMKGLEAMLDIVLSSTGTPLSANTAVGIQTLIWKKADAEFSQQEFDPAAKWCRLALHPVLKLSGSSNTGKMARRFLLCVIQQNDLSAASNILKTMNEETLKEPMTAYLAFKVALRQEDVDSALTCLKQISDAPSPHPQYLYACCLEAQQAQDKIITIKALQHIVFNPRIDSSKSVHLPALLRVLIRLEISVLDDEQGISIDRGSLVEDLCKIFKTAVEEIHKERQSIKNEKLFTIDELNWFCKNAYNLGLENAMAWDAHHVVTMLECCLSIVSSYPQDIPAQMAADAYLRGMFCDFMAATVLLASARSEDNTESRLQDYLNMRRHVQHFYDVLELRSDIFEQATKEDLQTKLSTLLVFEFEGATCLQSWDDLKGIVLRAQLGQSLIAYQAMADCILRCQSVPAQVMYQTMRELVNQIWTLERFDSEKLSKYMRCLLKLTLPMHHRIPLTLIEEIATMAKELAHTEKCFPSMELEWIIITAFNHGIDLYGTHEDDLSKEWISHAMTIAHYLRDGGKLEAQLQHNYTKLKWDDDDGQLANVA
ncbi:putative SPO22-domain-containing protein [Rosellinia necatrix]|uniref:Putative SPO22-domain-containing protein n=1 Tax=Rosellinia necatrix TaxID=77044 RepID=A0A1W2TC35_ROSNE|nr:putative SPO22-domain-containing protein [Rosellinia necatrix]